MSEERDKLLVLCVDRDDDIGVKAGATSPVIGRSENLEVASRLALIDPEESDANAIFGAIKLYDDLSSGEDVEGCEVATIAGSEIGGVASDKRIRDQLVDVLKAFPANSVILVTDGFSDEEVIPIIQSRIPILSVNRVVVRHSESIEESWALLSRYLRKAVEDPYYSRWIMGAPGLLLVVVGLLWQFVEIVNPSVVLLVVLGVLFMVKGFSIDKILGQFVYPSPLNLVRLFTTSIALTIGGLAFYQTYGFLLENFGSPDNWLTFASLPTIIGFVLRYSVDLLFVSFSIFIAGLGVYLYFFRDSRMLWSLVGLVVAVFMREISLKVSEILLLEMTPVPSEYWIELSAIILLGIVVTIITIFVTLRQGKRLERYFERMEKQDETG